jgi:hypothetical protein
MIKDKMLYAVVAAIVGAGFATVGFASDLAFYSGPTNPGWISAAAVKKNVQVIKDDPGIQSIFENIADFGDGDEAGKDSPLAKWAIAHTGNGQQDVLILACGTTPSGLYPFPNKEPDGSVVEEFIEAGNILINVADWIFYMSYEGGVRSPDNGPAGAANVFDIPGLSFGARIGAMVPNAAGKKYIPALEPFNSDRPWHLEQFKGSDWDVVTFAEAGPNDADPAVAIGKTPGKDGTPMIAALWQSARPDWVGTDPRGIGVAQFINNWLTENADLALAVDAKGKAATSWGAIKNAR